MKYPSGYPVPFRISNVPTKKYGMVDVVTSQYKTYVNERCVTRYETALFWGVNGESHDVTMGYDRTVAAKEHYRIAQQHVIAKEITKHYNKKGK